METTLYQWRNVNTWMLGSFSDVRRIHGYNIVTVLQWLIESVQPMQAIHGCCLEQLTHTTKIRLFTFAFSKTNYTHCSSHTLPFVFISINASWLLIYQTADILIQSVSTYNDWEISQKANVLMRMKQHRMTDRTEQLTLF